MTPPAYGRTKALPEQARLTALAKGHVQGVFYRAFTAEHAATLGITGYARNRPDGTVEIVAEGDRFRLEELLSQLRKGPKRGRVDSVDIAWSESQGRFRSFETL